MSPAVEVARQLREWIADDVRACSQRGVVNAIYQISRAYGLTPRRVRAIYHNEVKAPPGEWFCSRCQCGVMSLAADAMCPGPVPVLEDAGDAYFGLGAEGVE
jgi:hypothetical protein